MLVVLYFGIVPSGQIRYETGFSKPHSFIGKPGPKERVMVDYDKSVLEVFGGPLYFSLLTPRSFDEAELTIKYRYLDYSQVEAPIIEAGVLVDGALWRYDLKPVNNEIINILSREWLVIKDGGKLLLQKEEKYDTIDSFISNPPQKDRIALYNTDLDIDYVLPDYRKSEDVRSILGSKKDSLRGSFEILTYIKDEELFFGMDIVDLNKNKDADPVELLLFYDSTLLTSARLSDDGIATDNKKVLESRVINLKAADLPEGVYKVLLKAGDDIVVRNLRSNQSRIVFRNKLWLYEGDLLADIYTDGTLLNAQTTNPGKLQTVDVFQAEEICQPWESRICRESSPVELELSETYKLFTLPLSGGINRISLENDDIIISGNGLFAFDSLSYFNPLFKKIDNSTKLEELSADYIFADYIEPWDQDGWLVKKIKFDISRAYRENGKYGFLISIPGLRAEDRKDPAIEIDKIEVGLFGKSLFQKLYER